MVQVCGRDPSNEEARQDLMYAGQVSTRKNKSSLIMPHIQQAHSHAKHAWAQHEEAGEWTWAEIRVVWVWAGVDGAEASRG